MSSAETSSNSILGPQGPCFCYSLGSIINGNFPILTNTSSTSEMKLSANSKARVTS